MSKYLINPPKKSLGQNFLVDANTIGKIVACFNITATDQVLEIGPGHGALTKHLSKLTPNFVAVEKDSALATELANQGINVVNQDILEFDFSCYNNLKVVGNLPYNIASVILLRLSQYAAQLKDGYFMVQKEMAERIVAKPHKKAYGRLSIMLQLYFTPTLLFNIPPSVFYPQPKVDSSIIRLIPKPHVKVNKELFSKLVHDAFIKRRKMLSNSLAQYKPYFAEDFPIDLQQRAENLTVADFITITEYLSPKLTST